MVKSCPHDLLLDKKVIVCGEETVQILAELTLKEENFEDNLLFQATAYIGDNAGLERLLQGQFDRVLAIGKPVPQLDYLVDQRQERV